MSQLNLPSLKQKFIIATLLVVPGIFSNTGFADGENAPFSTCNPALVCDVSKLCDRNVICADPNTRDAADWTGNISVGFNYTSGNTDVNLFNIGALAQREVDRNIWKFSAAHSIGENNNQTNIDQTVGLAEYKRLLSDRIYLGLSTDFRRDDIADVAYRVIVNPSVGYFFIKSDDMKFNVEAGPSYVFEEVGGLTNDYLAPRLGERFEWQISDTAKFFEQVFILVDSEDGDNYLVNAEAGLETKIVGSWNLVLSARDVYDNVPAAGLKQNDLTFLTSLAYSY